jgi:hypothetical protein
MQGTHHFSLSLKRNASSVATCASMAAAVNESSEFAIGRMRTPRGMVAIVISLDSFLAEHAGFPDGTPSLDLDNRDCGTLARGIARDSTLR